jgi:hypothetical protein
MRRLNLEVSVIVSRGDQNILKHSLFTECRTRAHLVLVDNKWRVGVILLLLDTYIKNGYAPVTLIAISVTVCQEGVQSRGGVAE